jgi:hypothetical protein
MVVTMMARLSSLYLLQVTLLRNVRRGSGRVGRRLTASATVMTASVVVVVVFTMAVGFSSL